MKKLIHTLALGAIIVSPSYASMYQNPVSSVNKAFQNQAMGKKRPMGKKRHSKPNLDSDQKPLKRQRVPSESINQPPSLSISSSPLNHDLAPNAVFNQIFLHPTAVDQIPPHNPNSLPIMTSAHSTGNNSNFSDNLPSLIAANAPLQNSPSNHPRLAWETKQMPLILSSSRLADHSITIDAIPSSSSSNSSSIPSINQNDSQNVIPQEKNELADYATTLLTISSSSSSSSSSTQSINQNDSPNFPPQEKSKLYDCARILLVISSSKNSHSSSIRSINQNYFHNLTPQERKEEATDNCHPPKRNDKSRKNKRASRNTRKKPLLFCSYYPCKYKTFVKCNLERHMGSVHRG